MKNFYLKDGQGNIVQEWDKLEHVPPAIKRKTTASTEARTHDYRDMSWRKEAAELRQQRDELLAIVKELKDSHDACEDGIGFLTNRVWVAMNAAIAKAEKQ